MAVFLISYDLRKAGKNYDGVFKAIKESATDSESYVHTLESTWLIKSSLTPSQVSDKIRAAADTDDGWIVIEVRNNKQGWLSKEIWEKINKLFA